MANDDKNKVPYRPRVNFPVPKLNKGTKALRLVTGRVDPYAKLEAYTYTLLDGKYKGVVMNDRIRFFSADQVKGEEILLKYREVLPRPSRQLKEREKTDRDRIREAVLAGWPCFEFGWHLPESGPETPDHEFYLPLSFTVRHRVNSGRLTNLAGREGDTPTGELRNDRFVWTDNIQDESGADKMGLTVIGSGDLWFPERAKNTDCLLFIPTDAIDGNFIKILYDLRVKSGHLKDVTRLFASSRSEVEALEEVTEEVAAAEPTEEHVAKRSIQRRTVDRGAFREMTDHGRAGGKVEKVEESDSAADFPKEAIKKATPKPEKKSEVQPSSDGFKPLWRWCTNMKAFQGGADDKKGECPEYHVPVFTADPSPKCNTCGRKLGTPAKRDSKKFDEARSRLKIDLGFDPEEKWEADHESANPPSEADPPVTV